MRSRRHRRLTGPLCPICQDPDDPIRGVSILLHDGGVTKVYRHAGRMICKPDDADIEYDCIEDRSDGTMVAYADS